ncbi:hypothetical protein C7460_1192 [Marinoscillum furvescens DSM 4134]|uniref:Uncharacterized protein n=1 Tax=Marinoscillum furvescens DSM 4134 TaxID=1122208 RepID=A0A3D9KYL8_MARFU|nr:hypothetical protein C7460_1192 [Marinoscillum furvescens DSM 4134]
MGCASLGVPQERQPGRGRPVTPPYVHQESAAFHEGTAAIHEVTAAINQETAVIREENAAIH